MYCIIVIASSARTRRRLITWAYREAHNVVMRSTHTYTHTGRKQLQCRTGACLRPPSVVIVSDRHSKGASIQQGTSRINYYVSDLYRRAEEESYVALRWEETRERRQVSPRHLVSMLITLPTMRHGHLNSSHSSLHGVGLAALVAHSAPLNTVAARLAA